MTLAQLRAYLAELNPLPDDTLVIIAKDSEGSGYSPLDEAEIAIYHAETEYSGEHYPTQDPRPDNAVPAVFLWPTN